MENKTAICQSCGMPLDKDPNGGGTNSDQSRSAKYCSYCYKDGKFVDEGATLQQKIAKNIQIAVKMGMPEEKARNMAESTLPNLERWKN
ncbi:MAG: zinc ribbon domain-containing protein [Fibrobacter sp.]|nr:zinc ribbon domain-containing protein [Fibrobacter sp.]